MARMKEIDIAKRMVEYLTDESWEVYQEVKVIMGGGIADIVAYRKPVYHIIECKTAMSMSVIGQAWQWRQHAHLISICVPDSINANGRSFARMVLKNYGMGCYEAGRNGEISSHGLEPKLNRHAPMLKYLKDSLYEEQKTYCEAGSKGGGYWSPFKSTCRELLIVVKLHPGIRFKDAIEKMKRHHYSSDQAAYSSLRGWIYEGKVPGIKFDDHPRFLRLIEDIEVKESK